MKNKEKKIVRLLEEGFSYDTIKKMNDYHLNKIYKNLVNEEETSTVQKTTYSKSEVQQMKDKNGGLNVNGTVTPNDDGSVTVTQEMGEEDSAALDKMANLDPNEDPNPEGNEYGPSDNMNANDGMAIFEDIDEDAVVEELFGKPKMKTPITTLGMFEENNEYAICMDSIQGKYGPKKSWSKKAEGKFDACVSKVGKEIKESKIRQIEESIVSLIKKSQGKMITKGDLLSEQPSIAPSKPTVKPGVKPERGTPYKPKHSPKPKAGTEIAPARPTVKPGVKPERGTPYKPKHSPKPKAGDEGGLPEFLKFSNLNIQFRDE